VKKLAESKALKTVFLGRSPKITRKGTEQFNSTEVGWDEPQPSRLARNVISKH
jgi:hypothetical protein